jgi:hypothetical protein
VENNPDKIPWDFFVTKSKSLLIQDRPKSLPPIHSTQNIISSSDPQIPVKPSVLPPIEHIEMKSLHLPIIFILSKFFSF